jgi:lipoate-protein ligase B
MHGFALNVSVDVAPFARVVPCGIPGCRVTSMTAVLGKPVQAVAVRQRIAEEFARVFGLDWIMESPPGEAYPMPVLSGAGQDVKGDAR